MKYPLRDDLLGAIGFWLFSTLFGLCLAPALNAQTQPSAKASAPAGNESQQSVIIEKFLRKEKFENDGTYVQQDTEQVRIQSEAGLQRYGLLAFSFASATSTFEIVYVRVRKPDGVVVETPADSVQEMAAQITREAPFYSDLREKHVAVKGLTVGDLLEFQTIERVTKPLAPGQFWEQYNFTKSEILRDEELEISLPGDRAIKLKSVTLKPEIRDEAGYRVYTWHHSNLHMADPANEKREATAQQWRQERGRLPQPDIRLSSFASWDEVGRWYGDLQWERVKPTPEITAKAIELTKQAGNEDAKTRALYSYVATQFRYIGIAFGIGRYQPHTAAEVLANQYGDCKDKHTLMASLLAAAGISAYPALISTNYDIDPDVPMPGQFDHVITAVPSGGSTIWLDTTSEVGPYQYLIPPLRDKHALVIRKDKPAELMSTPARPLFPYVQTFHMTAKLDDDGTLDGRTIFTVRGDAEFFLRAGFRATSVAQWKDLVQRISYSSGFAGDVSEVNASSPERTEEPFRFEYRYVRKSFGDWPNHRILAPAPVMMLGIDEDRLPDGPIWLGAPSEVDAEAEVELPSQYHAKTPAPIHLKKSFAEYDSIYDFKDGKLISKRSLKILSPEVPSAEREEYKQFSKAVADDYGLFVQLSSSNASSDLEGVHPLAIPVSSDFDEVQKLPDSADPQAMRLEVEARDELARNNVQSAVTSLYRATSADPKFARAWIILGELLFSQAQIDAGMDAFHRAMAASPGDPSIPRMLGQSLVEASQFEAAVPVWQDYLKAHPEDADGNTYLGRTFTHLKRYPEAIAAFDSAAKVHPDRSDLQANLAFTYLLAGEGDKAGDAFRRLGDTNPDRSVLNRAAYEMAKDNVQLPVALEFANKAVRSIEQESQTTSLAHLTIK